MGVPDAVALRVAEKEVHSAYVALRVALERLHHLLSPPGTMQGEEGRPPVVVDCGDCVFVQPCLNICGSPYTIKEQP